MSTFKFGNDTKINGHVGDEIHYGDNKSSITINETIEKGDEIKNIVATEPSPKVKKVEIILIVIGLLAIIVAIIVGRKEFCAFFR